MKFPFNQGQTIFRNGVYRVRLWTITKGQKIRAVNDALMAKTAGVADDDDDDNDDDDGYRRRPFTHAEHAPRAADGTFLFHGHAVPGI